MNSQELVILPLGRSFIRTTSEVDVDITQQLLSEACNSTTYFAHDVAPGPQGPASLLMGSDGNMEVWAIPLVVVPFNAGVKANEDGTLSLDFDSSNRTLMQWQVPKDMVLKLVINIAPGSKGKAATSVHLLLRKWGDQQLYILPLANQFEDGGLCVGEGNLVSDQFSWLVVSETYKRWERTTWNSDLYSSKGADFKLRTNRLFRWSTPDGGQTFDTVPCDDWKSLCYAVANDNINQWSKII